MRSTPSSVRRAIVTLLALPAALAAQAVPDTLVAHPVALRDAVVLAEQNGLVAIQARGQIRTAESAVRAARGALLPSATLSLGQVNQSGERLDAQGRLVPYLASQPWTYSTGLNSSVNLFDGGRRWNEVKRSRYDVGAAEANEVTQKYSLALQVKSSGVLRRGHDDQDPQFPRTLDRAVGSLDVKVADDRCVVR